MHIPRNEVVRKASFLSRLWILLLLTSFAPLAQSQSYCLSEPFPLKSDVASYRNQEILLPCKVYWINVFIHTVIGYGNGWTGYSSTIEADIMRNLNSSYNDYGFYFRLIGAREWITNAYTNPNKQSIELIGVFEDPNALQHHDAIDIYVLPSNSQLRGGFVPSNNKKVMMIGGTRMVNHCSGGSTTYEVASTKVVSHEMGHCLGLQHTFDGSLGTGIDDVRENACVDPITCQFVNNCETCNVKTNPTQEMTNIMSGYTLPNCMSVFSDDQLRLMREKADDTMASVVSKTQETPSDIDELLGPSEVSRGTLVQFNVDDLIEKDLTLSWSMPKGFMYVEQDSGRSIQIWIGSGAESGDVEVWKSNLCGDGNKKTKNVTVIPDDCVDCPTVKVLPNPASDKIFISYSSQESGDQEFFENPREYTIVDAQGSVVQSITSKQTNIILDLTQPNGFYVLNIRYGNVEGYRIKFIVAR